jgi:predicted small lipoprotein YifL
VTDRRLLAVSLVALAALVGCGRKGPPLPPVYRIPAPTRDLAAVQDQREAVLRFSYPQVTADGGALPDLEAVEIWRVNLPVSLEPAGSQRTIRADRVRLLEARAERVVELDAATIAAATRGDQLEVRRDLGWWFEARSAGGDEAPAEVLWFAVRSVCCRGRQSDWSNIGRVVPREPPVAPVGLAAEAEPAGVRLSWAPDEGAMYRVERRLEDGNWSTLTEEPLPLPEWTDATASQDATWTYRVRVVAAVEGGGTVLGVPSAPLAVEFPDIYPPPPPRELICLPEGQRVRLRWAAVPEAETYRVVRQFAERAEKVLDDAVATPAFIDEEPPVGRLLYHVRAVDAAGNQSDAASCEAVIGTVGGDGGS